MCDSIGALGSCARLHPRDVLNAIDSPIQDTLFFTLHHANEIENISKMSPITAFSTCFNKILRRIPRNYSLSAGAFTVDLLILLLVDTQNIYTQYFGLQKCARHVGMRAG